MKTSYTLNYNTKKALFSTIIFALFFAAFAYLTKGTWGIFQSLESTTVRDLVLIPVVFIECCLISGFIISLVAYNKQGFHNLDWISEGGFIAQLLTALVAGLFVGLMVGGIWFFTNSLLQKFLVGSLTLIIITFLVGLIAGLIAESE